MLAVQTPWYYAKDGVSQGPLSWEELQEMARDGRLRKEDHVWNPDMTGWVPAFQQGDLFPAAPPQALAPPPLPADSGFDFSEPETSSGGVSMAPESSYSPSAEPAITFFTVGESAPAPSGGTPSWIQPTGAQTMAMPAMTATPAAAMAETVQLPASALPASSSNDLIALAPHPTPAGPQASQQPQRPRPATPLAGAQRAGAAGTSPSSARTGSPSTSRAPMPAAPAIDPDIEKDVKNAVVAACISGGITAIFALIATVGMKVAGIGAEAFFDVALVFGLAFGVSRKSRACAVILLLYFIASKIYMMSTMGKPTGLPLAFVFAYYYGKGVQATFKYHSARK